MSQVLYVRILKPITGYTENRIYDEEEVKLQQVRYANAKEGAYFRKLRVRSVYTDTKDVLNFLSKKYSLGPIRDYSMRYNYDYSETFTFGNKHYTVSVQEIAALKRPHVHESMYCDMYKDFRIDVYMSGALSRLAEHDFAVIDNALINKAICLVSEELRNEDEVALECCFEYETRGEGKLIASLLAAKEIAKRAGGIAILEYE